jgi:hypothetical protein
MKIKFYGGLAIVITALVWSSLSYALDKISYEYYPSNVVTNDNPIVVSFNGRIYAESWWFDEVENNEFSPSADESFVMLADSVNRNGGLNDLLQLWPPDERQEASDTFGDPSVLAGNQGYFRQLTNSAFLEKIAYGPYTIFLIEQSGTETGDVITEVPIIKDGSNYYLTNKLKSDPLFTFLIEKIKQDYE